MCDRWCERCSICPFRYCDEDIAEGLARFERAVADVVNAA